MPDRRLKSNIRQLPSSLETMLRVNPVSFTLNDNPGQTEYGFIAQDVQSVLPELVVTANDPSKTLGLNYPGFIAPLVRAMQELKAANDNEFAKLKADNDNLRAELDELRDEVRELTPAGTRR